MVELENYINFDICIFAIEEYDKRSYKEKQSTFRYYCGWVKTQISLWNKRNHRNPLDYIIRITKKIRLIYGLSETLAFQLVVDFFLEDRCEKFDEAARSILNYFPNSFS
jgi:hypothetical protein